MADNNEILKQASEALGKAIDEAKRNKALMASIGPAVVEMMTPVMNKIADDNKVTKQELIKALEAMTVTVSPEVNIPAVTLPDFKIPEFNIPQPKITINPEVKIPEIKLPKIVVPKPEVTITPTFKIPEIKIPTQVIKFPDYMDVRMKDITHERPLPVFLMNPSSGNGARGGLTLSDIVTPSGASIIDNVNNALNTKLVGASSVSLSAVDFNIGPSGSQTIRTTIATDSVNSINIQQINGNTIAVGSGEQNSNTIRTAFATDSTASVFVTGSTGSLATALIDSTGVQYSGSNPVPVTFSTGVNVNQWNGTTTDTNIGPSGAGTLRVTMATDANSSVNITQINGNAIATGSGEQNSNTIRTAFATDSTASVSVTNTVSDNIAQVNGNTVAVGSGEANSNTIRVAFATDTNASVSVTNTPSVNLAQLNGNTIAAGSGEAGTNTIRTVHATDFVDSVNIVSSITLSENLAQINGNTIATASGEQGTNTIRVAFATDSTASVQASGDVASGSTDSGNPLKQGFLATNTNVTRVSNAQRVNGTADLAGRQIITPMHVREMRTTAYVTLTMGSGGNSETTLLAGSASTFFDLVKIVCANQSTGVVFIDLRDGTGAGIVETYVVPGSGTTGSTNTVEIPMTAAGNTWTVKPNANNADLSNTTVTVQALFTKNT